jgi:hypothetical protein
MDYIPYKQIIYVNFSVGGEIPYFLKKGRVESTLQEPPWFPARLNLHYRQYEITEINWIILIFIVYLYHERF